MIQSRYNLFNPEIEQRLSFTSKVISVYPSDAKISEAEKDFINRFEESSHDSRINDLNCRYLGEGVCSTAYHSPIYNFVIKENKPNPYLPQKYSYDDFGTLYHENNILHSIHPKVENTQYGIALLETEKGGYYLISTLVQGERANVNTNPYTTKHVSRLLRTLYRLDKNGIVNTDLSGANILLSNDGVINLIDYQWAEKTKFTKDNYSYNILNFPEFEAPANDVMYERSALAGYLDALSEQSTYRARSFLRTYLEEKAPFCEKRADKIQKELETRSYDYYNASESTVKERIEFETLKSEIFKSPPESVIDTEVLKINMLKLQRKAHAFIDPNVIKPRNILMTVPYSIRAFLSANELSKVSSEEYYKASNPKLEKYFFIHETLW